MGSSLGSESLKLLRFVAVLSKVHPPIGVFYVMPKGLPTLQSLTPQGTSTIKIGFIGQGWIGRNYADNFEQRGYDVVRYSLESSYIHNKEKIQECDIVFIAVPTPTTPAGFDVSIVENALTLIGKGKIAVLKSTILPGITARLQAAHKDTLLMYAPEFLSETTAAYDAANPFSNIIGLSVDDAAHRVAADTVLSVLPYAPFTLVCTSTEAEVIKYSHNINGYFQVMLANVLYDAAQALGADWEKVREALDHDPYIANRYGRPVHKTGRGAGGGCFIKDFAAFREMYEKTVPEDRLGLQMLHAMESKNKQLLYESGKDIKLLEGVYGPRHPVIHSPKVSFVHAPHWAFVAAGYAVVLLGALDFIFIVSGAILS